jgi:hypothetical protein
MEAPGGASVNHMVFIGVERVNASGRNQDGRTTISVYFH